jgi:hypothetical protein
MASIKLNGVSELQKLLTEYPKKVQLTAQKRGLTRAASRLRALYRTAVPKDKGTLRKAIKYKTLKGSKGSKIVVGLLDRYYYKTLWEGRKAHTRLGAPRAGSAPKYSAKFANIWSGNKDALAQMVIDEARKALRQEAAKIHAKMLGIKARKI